MSTPSFCQFRFEGDDSDTFLQGQVTADVTKLGLSYQATAISNLKGRIEYGIWIKKQGEHVYDIVISQDCADSFSAHINKFGAFSKVNLGSPEPIYPCVIDGAPTFSHKSEHGTPDEARAWMRASLETGNYWIVGATKGAFQPQELRLHQRGGMDYDKGCYLGQEVIARIYFKSAPKAFLHYVKGAGDAPNAGDKIGKMQIVNAMRDDEHDDQFLALIVARPDAIEESDLTVLDLPAALQADVARPV